MHDGFEDKSADDAPKARPHHQRHRRGTKFAFPQPETDDEDVTEEETTLADLTKRRHHNRKKRHHHHHHNKEINDTTEKLKGERKGNDPPEDTPQQHARRSNALNGNPPKNPSMTLILFQKQVKFETDSVDAADISGLFNHHRGKGLTHSDTRFQPHKKRRGTVYPRPATSDQALIADDKKGRIENNQNQRKSEENDNQQEIREVKDDGGENQEKEDEEDEERPEYASDPREFTSSGTPLPFWMAEMKKGPEYLLKLHRKHGKREKHERIPAYKADLEVVSITTNDSFNDFEVELDGIYHPGLKKLIPVDRLFLFHRVEITSGVWSCLSKVHNTYNILNHHGHILYRVYEKYNRSCKRQMCYAFKDFWGREIMQVVQKNKEKTSFKRQYEIFCPPGESVGYVVQEWRCVNKEPVFAILDKVETKLIHFERIHQKFSFTSKKKNDMIFEYQSIRGQGPLGMVTTKLADLKMANFTERDHYGVKIHPDLNPNIKAKVMATWFVIYRLFYKGKSHTEVHHNLTNAARHLFADHEPSTEELPRKLVGDIVFQDRDREEEWNKK